jgi:hypothetical protein
MLCMCDVHLLLLLQVLEGLEGPCGVLKADTTQMVQLQ